VQRVISTVMYGNGASKQVDTNNTMLLVILLFLSVIPLFAAINDLFVIQWELCTYEVTEY